VAIVPPQQAHQNPRSWRDWVHREAGGAAPSVVPSRPHRRNMRTGHVEAVGHCVGGGTTPHMHCQRLSSLSLLRRARAQARARSQAAPRKQTESNMISPNANGERCKQYYDAISNTNTTVMFFDVCACTLACKKTGQHVTQQKIAVASKPHQKLIPICGVPVCARGVRQKKLHMGRHITHNEVVRI